MTDLISKVIMFAEASIADFLIDNSYDAAAIAFNMDAANSCVSISLTTAENYKKTLDEYKKLAHLPENVVPDKKYGNISKLPYDIEAHWEEPNIATMELHSAELDELRGNKRVKQFYEICGSAILDFMRTDTYDKLRRNHERFFFAVINKGDSEDVATEHMRKIHKKWARK